MVMSRDSMSPVSMLPCVFFFQAEDGIRDLVRSRGLGDVYKRQVNDYMDIPVTICEGATVTLEWTNLGNYPDEKALQFYNPFGVLLYDHRGTGPYTNCPGANWTSANSAGTTGVKFTTTSNCTPPTCSVTPSFVDDCLAGTYDITLTDIDVTGNGTIQYLSLIHI